jgi:hypothetical protein
MEFSHDKSWDCLTNIYSDKLTAKNAWNKFIDFHEQILPKNYWNAFRQIDIEEEQSEIVDWLQQVVISSPIPESVVALWIGIVRFADNDKEIPTIYFIGTDTYNKEDIDWASDPTYLPENRYAQPGVLQQIDDIAKLDIDNYEFFDWILPLAYCTFTFDEIIRTKLNQKLFLNFKNKLHVAVGHDSGDYMDLSYIE